MTVIIRGVTRGCTHGCVQKDERAGSRLRADRAGKQRHWGHLRRTRCRVSSRRAPCIQRSDLAASQVHVERTHSGKREVGQAATWVSPASKFPAMKRGGGSPT